VVPGVAAAALAAQPLAVEQVRAGQLRDDPALLQLLDGKRVLGFGVVIAGEQRPAAGQHPERPVGSAGQRPRRECLQGGDGGRPITAPGRRLDHFGL